MSSPPRLLFAVESPFSERDWRRFGIDELSTRFQVSIIDVSPLSRPLLASSRGDLTLEDVRIIRVDTLAAVQRLFAEVQQGVFLNNVGSSEIRFRLFQMAREQGMVTAEFELGAMPVVALQFSSKIDKFIHRFRQLPSVGHLPRAVLARWHRREWADCIPDVFFRGGVCAHGRHHQLGSTVVDVHSLDYESTLDLDTNDQTIEDGQVVYLDQNLGFHSDVPGLGLRHPVNPELFYPVLNSYFDWLEHEHDLRVVICPHPRAQTDQTRERFPHRTVSQRTTAAEIWRSIAVLGHISTSFSFAVLAQKPTITITSNEMSRSWYAPYVDRFRTELAAPQINLDDRSTWTAPRSVLDAAQSQAYAEYLTNYLRSYEGPIRRLWKMVGDELLQRIKV